MRRKGKNDTRKQHTHTHKEREKERRGQGNIEKIRTDINRQDTT